MENIPKSTLRSNRKPLSDCTNTQSNLISSKLISQTPIKPPFVTPIADKSNQIKKNENPNFNLKLDTSINNSPISDIATPKPRTPLSRAGDMKHGSSATRARHQEEQMRKDKGKSVEATPITRASTRLTSRGVQISSSAASDVNGHDNRRPIASIHDIDEQKRKEKGKMVVETPMIYISTPSLSPALQPSSSGASGNCYGPSAVHSHKQDAQAKKDNTKIGQEMPNNEESDPTTPRSLIISSSEAAATDGEGKSRWIVYNQRRPSERKKRGVGSISLPFSCPPDTRTKKKREELDDGHGGLYSGSRTDPLPLPKKKRRAKKNDESSHAMPQDEVAKLKSYFAEIDEFELPEEVASESELE